MSKMNQNEVHDHVVMFCCTVLCAIWVNSGCHQSGLEKIQYTTLWSFPTKLFGSSYHMGTSVLI